jgi:hypothetical protein
MHIDAANDPIVMPRIVVDSGSQEVDVVGPETPPRLIVDGFPAGRRFKLRLVRTT